MAQGSMMEAKSLLKPALRRSAFQEEQRRLTRHAICTAALAVFAQNGFAGSAIEPILLGAGVSRAAFYSHFDSKLAVVYAIAEDFEPRWLPVFQRLTELGDPTLADLVEWAESFLDVHRSNIATCSLLTQIAAIDRHLYALIARQRDELISMLGQHFPAFADARTSPRRLLEARMLLWQVDQICFRVVNRDFTDCESAAPRVIAGQLLDFLRQSQTPRSGT
ncbi:TetR/AcrR family transcriptional regulator [Novosphingobium sp.]|uniref:TetR/AcrR family transcriptional regulator n=1 Tax=Novosphingobium sp. TaxID=1874826 RepID=UPI003B526DEC